MVKLKLRDDGWFEEGKDNAQAPIARVIYQSKQILKGDLEKIGPCESRIEFGRALSRVPLVMHFEGRPFLDGNDVCIMIEEMGSGKIKLGEVVEG